MIKLAEKFNSFKMFFSEFFSKDERSELDKFIASKDVATQADLDFWLREWDLKKREEARNIYNRNKGAMWDH